MYKCRCEYCGSEFEARYKDVKICNPCKSRPCEVCGKPFKRDWPYDQHCCSKECRTIWKTDPERNKEWTAKRDATVKERYGVSNVTYLDEVKKKANASKAVKTAERRKIREAEQAELRRQREEEKARIKEEKEREKQLAKIRSGSSSTEIWYTATLGTFGWTLDSETNTYIYSFESTYPNNNYDIVNVLPNDDTTSEMRSAWVLADCGGYEPTNIIRCHGTVPTSNITLGICIRSKDGSVPPQPPAPPQPTIAPWSTGTDAEIAYAVDLADKGKIDLSEYWHVGDERVVHLNAMEATGVGESHAAQDVTFVIMNVGGKTLTTPTEGGKQTCNFVVGMKNCLNETGYLNSTHSNNGSWSSSARRTWCNSTFKNAIPSTLLPIFKQFQNVTAESYNGSTNQTTDDYFALPAAAEVFKGDSQYGQGGTAGQQTAYSNLTEFNALSRFTYYETTSNIVKTVNGSANAWWERSPYYNASTSFCSVLSGGNAANFIVSYTIGIAPFGCI